MDQCNSLTVILYKLDYLIFILFWIILYYIGIIPCTKHYIITGTYQHVLGLLFCEGPSHLFVLSFFKRKIDSLLHPR